MTPALLAFACLIAVTLGYVVVCAAQPFATCRTCHGIGHQLTTDRNGRPKRGKPCRRCKTTGLRIRTGRRLLNAWQRTYRNGTR
ncbi:hypothetical protein OG871_18025 [Kitasatospora sp. NBC_00374]|uniref:hypothetical protein n=1 Tax=Kitasatospora sp. NBC_00374 TaxID=2975964 RepID=UPI00324E8503